MGNELTHKSFVVLEGDDSFILITGDGRFELDSLVDQPLDPEANRAGEDCERCYGDLAATLSATTRVRPWEKREDASRSTLLVTEVEMVRGRIVEVYSSLDEPESESTSVEVEIPLRVARDTGDVMNTGGAEAHRTDSCLAFLRSFALIGARAWRAGFTAVTAFVLC
jgi:hypothetical protein